MILLPFQVGTLTGSLSSHSASPVCLVHEQPAYSVLPMPTS